jgi:lipid-A kinase
MLNVMTTRFPLILLLNAAGLALFLSWYLPVNHGFWFPLDSAIFHFFNQALVKSDAFLWLVAITNNRAFDGCSLLAMGCLMLSFWLKEDKTGRRRIVMAGLVMLLTAVVINQLAQHLMPVKRASPSLYFPDIHRVSELLHIPTKDASKDSFPGDHGMMLLIFSAFMLRYFRQKSLCDGAGNCGGICFPARHDRCSLADGYCRGFALCGTDWFAVGADDAVKRSINRYF